MTVADRMIDEGRAEGRAEARREVHREHAEKLVRLRAKLLVDAVLAKMRTFDDAQYEALCETLLDPAFEAEALKAFRLDDTNG